MSIITVIIPSFRPGNYLWECLGSLVNQTFPKEDFDIILVLNGCNDPYKSDIEKYISTKMQGLNINFIHTLQEGVSNARNIALDYAKGQYITFIDDDDFVSPNYLEELYNNADLDTIVLSYPYAFNDGYLGTQRPYHITEVYDTYSNRTNNKISSKVSKYFSGPWMKLIPTSIIQNRRFDVRFKNGEDTLFMFLISDKIKNIRFTSRNAIYYRRYRLNSAVTIKRSRWYKIKNSCKIIISYISMFFSLPLKYNFTFFTTRVLGAIKYMLS